MTKSIIRKLLPSILLAYAGDRILLNTNEFLDPECAVTAWVTVGLIETGICLSTPINQPRSFVVQHERRGASNPFAKASAKKQEPQIAISSLVKKDLKSYGSLV